MRQLLLIVILVVTNTFVGSNVADDASNPPRGGCAWRIGKGEPVLPIRPLRKWAESHF
jgi:hypothetical protein